MQVGDTGVDFEVCVLNNCEILNIAGAAIIVLEFQGPSDLCFQRSASISTDGSDGKLKYITASDDFTVAGQWITQAIITTATQTFRTNVMPFQVYGNLGC